MPVLLRAPRLWASIVAACALSTTLLASDAPRPSGSAAPDGSARGLPVWTEVAWPFLIDQWGTGRAFRCDAAHCGRETFLYVRPKIGFCNCTTGVADDDDMDRVSDVDLLAEQYAPVAAGRAVMVGPLTGWTRSYQLRSGSANGSTVLSLAFSDNCSVMVATATSGNPPTPSITDRVREFLGAGAMLQWAKAALES